MAMEKTNAIVLRVIEFSETSCIVTLMTRDHGKITAMAKGARRPKSPFEAALDVLAICRIVFLQKSSTALDLLTEAKLERRFRCAATSLDRLYAGYYVAELLDLLTDDSDPHADLYDFAVETINAIDSNDRTVGSGEDLDQTVLDFELNALRSLGHLPMLTQCVSCGRSKQTLNRVSFGMNAGGILCRQCRAGERNVVSLSSDGLGFLLKKLNQKIEITEYPEANRETDSAEVSGDTEIPTKSLEQTAHEVRGLLRNYISHLVGRPPRLQKFLNRTQIQSTR
jgi:DNA repair protein RecO (recombination protein O)